METIRDALDAGWLPCVLVIAAPAAPAAATLGRVRWDGKALVASLHPVSLERFGPVDALELPVGEAYRLHDVDRGDGLRNVTPAVAHEASAEPGRSPWTIGEGVAVLTHHPLCSDRTVCGSGVR